MSIIELIIIQNEYETSTLKPDKCLIFIHLQTGGYVRLRREFTAENAEERRLRDLGNYPVCRQAGIYE